MSIKNDVMELESIQTEKKILGAKLKKLREREKAIQSRIAEFLRSKDQIGVKHQGTAVVLEEKEVREKKKNKERDADAIAVLRDKFGIADPEKALAEIMEARKGAKLVEEKLHIKKYKG